MGEMFAGRFELVEPLAEGGMGSVWVVRDHRDGEVYAAKLLRQSDAGSLVRFIREQATRISHEHVVTPLSWAGEDDRVLFTMPLVRGGSVADLIGDHGALPPEWVAGLLDQTLQALEAVHAAGVVHRDVKPANLLLQPTGTGAPHLLLTDFGISARITDARLTSASQVIGTPGYMAPEQVNGADPHPTQDVYAAGMVGLEMLTGIRPSRNPAGSGPPAGHHAALSTVLLRATALDPRDRPQSATELRGLLSGLRLAPPVGDPSGVVVFDQLTDLSPTRTRPDRRPTGGHSPTPTRARDRWLAALLVTVAVLCMAAVGWLLAG